MRDSEPSIATVLALFRVVPAPLSSAGVLGGHIPALLGAPDCTPNGAWLVRGKACVRVSGTGTVEGIEPFKPALLRGGSQ